MTGNVQLYLPKWSPIAQASVRMRGPLVGFGQTVKDDRPSGADGFGRTVEEPLRAAPFVAALPRPAT